MHSLLHSSALSKKCHSEINFTCIHICLGQKSFRTIHYDVAKPTGYFPSKCFILYFLCTTNLHDNLEAIVLQHKVTLRNCF